MYKDKKLLITACSLLAMMFFLTAPAFADVYESVANAKNVIQNTPLDSFKNPELKTAYAHDLDGINSTLLIAEDEVETAGKNQLYQDALETVNKLIDKTDGCNVNGVPDDEDWIVNCTDSSQVHAAITQLAVIINTLIQ